MGIVFTIAARNLLMAKRRSAFLGLALGLVTMMLVLLLSLSQGLSETMIDSATTLSAGHVNVSGFYKATISDAAPIITKREEIRKIVEENTPGLDYVIDRHRGWARLVSETSSLQAGLTGVEVKEDRRLLEMIRLAEEREYKEGGSTQTKGDVRGLAEPNSALFFASQAKRLGIEVGDDVTVTIETLSGLRNTAEVRVVAIAKDVGMLSNWSVFMNRQAILDLYRLKPDTTGAVQVYLKDITKAGDVMDHLRKVFADKGFKIMDHEPNPFFMKFEKVAGEDWLGQKLDFTIWRDEVSFLTWVLSAVDSVSFFLIGVLLVIIIVGIMNSMYISVRERTREIGTVRAIGMGRGAVMGMFMAEAIMLALVATSLGALAGAGIALGIDAMKIHVPVEAVQMVLMSDTVNLVVKPQQLIAAILGFSIVTAISALYPAIVAARLQPVTAMQSVT